MAIGQEIDFLFREVDRGLDIDTQGNQCLCQAVHTLGEFALQRAQGIACSLAGARLDQVSDGFRLGQIQLVIEERPLAEFAWPRQTAADLYTALQQHIQYHWAAMPLQLEYILAGKRVRPWEIQRNAFIQHQAILIAEWPVVGMAWRQRPAGDQLARLACQWPGQPDDTDATAALGGGDGSDGFTHSVHARKPLRQNDR